ncbi:MAG: NAD(P)-binding protein [Deltaproteobacteria bacterium]|nr:NAD(P)-binding protein [Deltaproteobacteria bacterium]
MRFGRWLGSLDHQETQTLEQPASSTPLALAVQPLRVGVVGATLSGLATAWELEQAGHHVIVFDHALSVGDRYRPAEITRPDGRRQRVPTATGVQADDDGTFARWTSNFGVDLEPITGTLVDADDQAISPTKPLRELQTLEVRARRHRRSTRAAHHWFSLWRLDECYEWLCLELARAGRADLAYPELPTFLVFRAARSLGLIPASLSEPKLVHVRAGLDELCRQIARELGDVRLGQRVRSVNRAGARIALVADGVHQLDCLVVACKPVSALKFLDANPVELRNFDLVRSLRKLNTIYTIEGPTNRPTRVTRVGLDLTESVTSSRYDEFGVVRFETHFETVTELVDARARITREAERILGPNARVSAEEIGCAPSYVDSGDFRKSTLDEFVALQGSRNTYYTELPLGNDFPKERLGIASWLRRRLRVRRLTNE